VTAHEREQLIVEHYPLVKIIARQMANRFPKHVDLDELISTGMLGLIDAVDRFDAARGVPIKAYAEIRIRGAIIDAMRQSDWVPRDVRRRSGRIDAARTALRARHGIEPDRLAMAAELGVSADDYDALVDGSQIRGVVSLDAKAEDGGVQVASPDPTAVDLRIADEDAQAVSAAIATLPEKERIVATMYYQRGLQLKEIGAHLGVSEGRVSQIRSRAVERLRARLRPDDGGGPG
jgi:RNA polymerase sigma factor for flagellar operon FliA